MAPLGDVPGPRVGCSRPPSWWCLGTVADEAPGRAQGSASGLDLGVLEFPGLHLGSQLVAELGFGDQILGCGVFLSSVWEHSW